MEFGYCLVALANKWRDPTLILPPASNLLSIMKLAATTALLVYLCLDGISAFTPPTTIPQISDEN